MPDTYQIILSVLMGIALSSACGFRLFVPVFIVALGVRADYIHVGADFAWLSSDAAVYSLGIATVLEICAYFIPALDHFLDVVATPIVAVAGTVLSASMIMGMDPWLHWTLALIGGGGSAVGVHIVNAAARAASTASGAVTAGGNAVINVGETIVSSIMAIMAPFFPIIVIAMLVIFVLAMVWCWKSVKRLLKPAPKTKSSMV